jgi:hypothetical protein
VLVSVRHRDKHLREILERRRDVFWLTVSVPACLAPTCEEEKCAGDQRCSPHGGWWLGSREKERGDRQGERKRERDQG